MMRILFISGLLSLVYSVYSATSIHLEDRNNNISSPSYPGSYPHNQDIQWILQSDTPLNFSIILHILDLEESIGCKSDYLQLFKYSDGYREELIGPWCRKLKDLQIFTVSYGLLFHFKSDLSVTGQGFHLSYATNGPNSDTLCNIIRVSHSAYEGFVSTANVGSTYRYPATLNCSWLIPIPDGYAMFINVISFNIEYFGPDCSRDYLFVSSFQDEKIKDIGKFCGKRRPWRMTVQAKNATISFLTDWADNIGGLYLHYSMAPSNYQIPVFGPYQVQTDGDSVGIIEVDSSWKKQMDRTRFTWHIQTVPGSQIIISAHVNSEHVNGLALLTYYDGPDNSFTRVSSYDLSRGSVRRTSSGFHVFLEAYFDDGSTLEFLRLSYETFNYFRTGEGPIRYLDIGDRTYVKNPRRRFRCCTYNTIVAPPGKTIAFDLLDLRPNLFRDASNTEECAHSGIVVFDGDFSNSRLIGPVCDVTKNKMHEYFKNFVSSSSTIYVLTYSYTNDYGRLSPQYELEPRPTVCQTLHMTEMFVKTMPDQFTIDSKYHIDKLFDGSQVQMAINYTEIVETCFVIYFHPWRQDEPSLVISLPQEAKSHEICHQWSFLGDEQYKDVLSTDSSKFAHTTHCHIQESPTNGSTVYRLDGTNDVKWSQRLAKLEIGNVKSRVCAGLPDCSGNRIVKAEAFCGTIYVEHGPACTWHIQSSSEIIPHYWDIEILYAFASGKATLSCYLKLEESINGHGTKMTTLFHCVDMNLARLWHYRTMDRSGYFRLTNIETSSFKVRYALKYISTKPSRFETDDIQYREECDFFQNSCYRLHRPEQSLNWLEAEDYCSTDGGHLVSILSADELEFVKTSLATEWKKIYYTLPLGLIYIGLNDIEKPGDYKWLDGSPLTVSDWYTTWNYEHNIIPIDPPLNISRELPQPTSVPNTRCVAIVVANPYYSTNWRKISCNALFRHVSFICKHTNETYSASSSRLGMNVTHADSFGQLSKTSGRWRPLANQLSICPDDWTPINGKCFAMLSEDIALTRSTSFNKAEPLCRLIGGTLASISAILQATLMYYLKLWGINPGDGNILLRTKSENIGCTSFSTLHQGMGELSIPGAEDCVINEGRAAFVLCERDMESVNVSCAKHQFSCQDGTCLNMGDVCDGQADCFDGEDEDICPQNNSDYLFYCHDNGEVSISKYCDFYADCQDASDEVQCIHRSCSEDEFRCSNGQCISNEYMCDHAQHCVDGSDEESCDWGVVPCKGFGCPAGDCLPQSRVHDLIPDCLGESGGDEESNDNRRMEFYIEHNQEWKYIQDYRSFCPGTRLHRRCHRDRIKCFHRAKTCVYEHDDIGDLLHCRDGSHLEDCGDYPCLNMFKCANSYCLPLEKICDGVVDCPGGLDEKMCESYSCPGQLKCQGSQQCVPQEKVCDGRVHCNQSWSDERFCDLANNSCPSGCICHGYALNCSNGNHSVVPQNLSTNVRVLLLNVNLVKLASSSLQNLSYLHTLRLASNSILSIPISTFSDLLNLQVLDLRANSISYLNSRVFYGLSRLVDLYLKDNPINTVTQDTFLGLATLPLLNLSGMSIRVVPSGAFNGLESLQSLDLSKNQLSELKPGSLFMNKTLDALLLDGNNLDKTDPTVFKEITVSKLWTDSYRFCCFAGDKVKECHPGTDAFSSCEDLLSTTLLQWGVWFLGIISVCGNSMVIIWHIYAGCSNTSTVFVFNLALSDVLMGFYLIVLASMDVHYRGNYIYYDVEWRDGPLCIVLGVMSTTSCLMSLLTLVCIAWDRFLNVVFPFSGYTLNTRKSWALMLAMWLVALTSSLIPLAVPSYFGSFYSRNSICLPFNFTNPTGMGWEYAAVVFVGLAGSALLLVIVLYAIIYCTVHESQVTAGRQDRSDLVVARRLSLVVVTNVVSWIPVIMANIISMSGSPLTREMAAILTTIILPLNSALNPYLYTFSSCRRRKGKPNVS